MKIAKLAIAGASFVFSASLVFSTWPGFAVYGAEKPAAAPKVSTIKDGSMMEVFLRFSPDGKELARIPRFGPVRLSDTDGYKKLRSFKVGMRMVAYSPDGTRMATAEGTDGARVWDTAAKGTLVPEAKQAEVHLLETPLKVLQEPSKDAGQRVFWAEFSPDGKRLVTTQANGHVKVWNTETWVMEDDVALTDSEVRAAAISPDSKSLIFGDAKGVLHHWSFETKEEVKGGLNGNKPLEGVSGVVFSPDGKTLVTTHPSEAGTVMIWNTSTWVARKEEGYTCAAFSKDGKVLALGGNHIRLFHPASPKPIRTIELPEETIGESVPGAKGLPNANQHVHTQINALTFSPDGRTLAVGSMGPLQLVEIDPK